MLLVWRFGFVFVFVLHLEETSAEFNQALLGGDTHGNGLLAIQIISPTQIPRDTGGTQSRMNHSTRGGRRCLLNKTIMMFMMALLIQSRKQELKSCW